MNVITIERKVLAKNDQVAAENRAAFAAHHLFVVNMVSSPGAGKTSLLERTLETLQGSLRVAVVEGDVQTDLDARRVARYGVPAVQIVTHGGCHLEAKLVQDAIAAVDLAALDLLVIENVGNLVCPANYDLGEAMKIVVVSTTEGDDKPLKYPAMFRNASVLVINKMDLAPYLDADPDVLEQHARRINPSLTVFRTSCRTGAGIDAWCAWLTAQAAPRP
jgi:hydrogenase nickel incorporation protein HypB